MRVLFLNNERRNLLIALSKYRLCLENRCLLERNAEILYPTFRSGAAVQELIKDMCISNGQLSAEAETIRKSLLAAGFTSAAYPKSIVDQMRNKHVYQLMSSPIYHPQLISSFTGWALGGDGGLAPAPLLPHSSP